MGSVSALLKSSQSRRTQVQNQQDAFVSFEWSVSEKSYDQFLEYEKYLQTRLTNTTDPSKALSYTRDIFSARKGYTSNEIQRSSINVIEGKATTQNKYDTMVDLYYQAGENGDFDLAQSLRLQLNNLSVTLQGEAEAAQRVAGQLATLRVESVQDAVKTIKGYATFLGEELKTRGAEGFGKVIKQYAKELGVEGGDFFGILASFAGNIKDLYENAIQAEGDPKALRALQGDYDKFKTENIFTLPTASGKNMGISFQDIVNQADASRVGEEIFEATLSGDGTVFTKNIKTGFVWGRDETGNYRAISLYSQAADFTSKILKDKNKPDEFYNYEELLKLAGYEVSKEGGALRITPTRESGTLKLRNVEGLGDNQSVLAYVDKDGKLQIKSGERLFELKFDETTGEFAQAVETTKSPITLLSDRFSADFLRKLDFTRLSEGTVGIINQRQISENIKTIPFRQGGPFKPLGSLGLLPTTQTPGSITQSGVSTQQAGQIINPPPASSFLGAQPQLQGGASASQILALPPQPTLSVKTVTTPALKVAPAPVLPKLTVTTPVDNRKLVVR